MILICNTNDWKAYQELKNNWDFYAASKEFDYPEYANLPKDISEGMSGNFVDGVQNTWTRYIDEGFLTYESIFVHVSLLEKI